MAATVQSLFSLSGRTAVVTGGTRGIGQAMALALAEAGADIILIQRDESNTATKDEIINRLGRKAHIHVAELSDRKAVKEIIPAVVSQGFKPDILLNCAGIQRRHPSEKFPDEDWDEVSTVFLFIKDSTLQASASYNPFISPETFANHLNEQVLEVNLSQVFILCREFGAYLLARDASEFPSSRRGSIINVASLLTFQGGITVPAYAASKGGVGQLTKALSNEWVAKGINVNAIAPGYIATDMNTALINDESRNTSIMARIPAGRWGQPEDFKGVVVFLASGASSYVSGEIITVDGGWMGR
jgi:2-deoxy-D-gluconate 3-dehydrogenase